MNVTFSVRELKTTLLELKSFMELSNFLMIFVPLVIEGNFHTKKYTQGTGLRGRTFWISRYFY